MSDKAHELAKEILSLTRGRMLVNFRYLDMALFQLKDAPQPVIPLSTDGVYLYYRDSDILSIYRNGQTEMTHSLMHMLLHCIFRHMFVSAEIDRPLWNLACDLAVEAQILSFHQLSLHGDHDSRCENLLNLLKKPIGELTAERLYSYLKKNPLRAQHLMEYCHFFAHDEHEVWYAHPQEISVEEEQGAGEEGGGNSAASSSKATAEQMSQSAEDWEKISRRMQTDFESFAKQQGTDPGSMLQALQELHREKYDYAAFLHKFATRHEVMKLSEDEFDYVFYTYGLKVYKDMPIIEPLEYRDDKRISELVIAIDTSGSTSGELVQTFLQKTYNILKQEETFLRRFTLHIIQCDAQIQEDAVITTQAEFDDYIQKLTIKGLGGTDFRPVFRRVNELIEQHAFRNLKGLIYFTDGYGTFPEKKPEYETAFVFVEDDATNVEVPPWAVKLILRSDEILEE